MMRRLLARWGYVVAYVHTPRVWSLGIYAEPLRWYLGAATFRRAGCRYLSAAWWHP